MAVSANIAIEKQRFIVIVIHPVPWFLNSLKANVEDQKSVSNASCDRFLQSVVCQKEINGKRTKELE
ncbi:hypothetical protein TUMSATVNIG3_05600 [Vibrio nigripulchritudo]|nr:hypothetical protein TUMSATVNIG3_05600 [Vibrio nigripulchritudo]